ncbi:asparagine synthase (glutamine-hydrolyzing) [candidate division KSB1 bacterium]|nr:asparagine synthase (glutamine-hydrolyzing) [candidate division KSB1 bacterium]
MCGITGKIFIDINHQVDPHLIREMTSTLTHRGPDDAGMFVRENMGIGMQRLSIIDVTAGHQPMFNEDRSKVIVFNGEIYNYRSIKNDLVKRGHHFTSNSDTEVIIHSYEEFGVDCLQHFNGMFAFAIFDVTDNSLFIARDRLGIKPLYYYLDSERLLFGSEIKAILADPSIPRVLDLEALDLYLRFLYVPAPFSMFKGISKLPAAHYGIFTSEGLKLHQYWDVPFQPDTSASESDFQAEFNELFRESVEMRMISDVPLGAFLSGGIDSSSIVAMMSQASSTPIKTFSIGFKEGGYHDETAYARQVADYFNTDHTEFHVDANVLDLLPTYIHHFDEPFGDYAAFPTFLVSKLAREHVTVVLTGDGGDEVFAGYERYASEQLATYYGMLPKSFRDRVILPLLQAGQSVISSDWRLSHYFADAIKKTRLMNIDPGDRYILSFHKFNNALRSTLYTSPHPDNIHLFRQYWDHINSSDRLSQQLYLDIKTSLPDDMLTKVDRTTMATSLEARVPFLDHRIVELAGRMPSSMKLRPWLLKRFVKRAMHGILPEEIIKRRKHGFSAPMDRWLRHDMRELLCDTLSEQALNRHGLFHSHCVQSLITNHLNGVMNNGVRLFMLMVFQMWHDTYILNYSHASEPQSKISHYLWNESVS